MAARKPGKSLVEAMLRAPSSEIDRSEGLLKPILRTRGVFLGLTILRREIVI